MAAAPAAPPDAPPPDAPALPPVAWPPLPALPGASVPLSSPEQPINVAANNQAARFPMAQGNTGWGAGFALPFRVARVALPVGDSLANSPLLEHANHD